MTQQTNLNQSGFDPDNLHRIKQMMDRYVAESKTAGMLTLVSHKGKIIHFEGRGYRDIATQSPIQNDTIFRIYSMTKAITSVALMSLLEAGHFQLDDTAYRWIPELKKLKVYRCDGALEALESDITIRQLLTHTAGFTYGFEPDLHPVDKMYGDIWADLKQNKSLAELMAITFKLPLYAQPGSIWRYSIATDICGYLIELMSGMPFGDYLQKTIFEPLAMVDTAFEVPENKRDRFATLYGISKDDPLAVLETIESSPFIPAANMKSVKLQSGGGGLVSTIQDYWHFAQMMLNRGELNGVRILQPQTVGTMTHNHIADHLLPLAFNGIVPEMVKGYGFGLGYCINMDTNNVGSVGDFGWGGMADTYCWIDPKQELVGILMQQFMPSLTHAGRSDFRNAVYQSPT